MTTGGPNRFILKVSTALEQTLETMSYSYSLTSSTSIEDQLVYPLAASVAHLVSERRLVAALVLDFLRND